MSKKAPAQLGKEALSPASFHPKHPSYTEKSVIVSENEDTKYVQKATENGRVVKTIEEKAIEGIKKISKPSSGNSLNMAY